MARLISYDCIRQKALADQDSGEAVVYLQDIAEAPTVDAVEVVRCKDCKYWFKFESSLIGEVMCCTGQGSVNILKSPYDFCSCGKRKDGDSE